MNSINSILLHLYFKFKDEFIKVADFTEFAELQECKELKACKESKYFQN